MARAVKQGVFRDGNGAVVTTSRNGTVAVFLAGTTTPANIYVASAGGTPVYSVNTDASGRFKFYVDSADYTVLQLFDIVLSGTGVNAQTYANEMVGAGVALLTPATSTVGNIVLWNDTLGETVSDSGVAIGTLMDKTGSNLAIGSDANGDMYYRASGMLARLAKGAANLKLFMNAAGTAPEWADGYKTGTFTKTMTDSSTTQAITGVWFKPRMIIFIAAINATYTAAWGFAIGTTGYGIAAVGTSGYYYHNDTNVFVIYSPTSGDSQAAVINSDDVDGFTIGWTKCGSPTGTATIQYIAVR